jgi:hypothetical protein
MDKKANPAVLTPEERAKEHRRQLLLQVWLPLTITILVVIGLAGLTIAGAVMQSSQVNRWGSLSAIYLIIPNLVINIIFAALLVLMAVGLRKFHQKLPGWLKVVQNLFASIASYARKAADRLVAPMISFGGTTASIRSLFRRR